MLFLDIETTGLDYTKHQILSLGMLYVDEEGNTKEFLENCSYKEYTVTPEALNVNGIDLATHKGYSIVELEAEAIRFLLTTELHKKYMETYCKEMSYHSFTEPTSTYNFILSKLQKESSILPIGFNIGTFDMMFIKKYLPEFNKLFSYRAVDLNSIIYMEAEVNKVPYEKLKKYYSKKFEVNHNALDDCRKAYEVYKEIVDSFRFNYERKF